MTNIQAWQEIATLSAGTIATMTGIRSYSEIDAYLTHLHGIIVNDEIDFSDCKNWVHVWNKLHNTRY